VRITATVPWSGNLDLPNILGPHAGDIDGFEVRVLGTPWPPQDCLKAIREIRDASQVSITLSTVLPGQLIPGRRYTRIGYSAGELVELDRRLAASEVWIDRVLCMLPMDSDPGATVARVRTLVPLSHLGTIDLALDLQSDDRDNAYRVAEAIFAAAVLQGSRVYVGPLVDVGRMIYVTRGLLDSTYNPRPSFHVLRCLNTILWDFSKGASSLEMDETVTSDLRMLTLSNDGKTLALLLPRRDEVEHSGGGNQHLFTGPASAQAAVYRLAEGTSECTTLTRVVQLAESGGVRGPTVVAYRSQVQG
jgi:hypothetical protein